MKKVMLLIMLVVSIGFVVVGCGKKENGHQGKSKTISARWIIGKWELDYKADRGLTAGGFSRVVDRTLEFQENGVVYVDGDKMRYTIEMEYARASDEEKSEVLTLYHDYGKTEWTVDWWDKATAKRRKGPNKTACLRLSQLHSERLIGAMSYFNRLK